MKKFFTGVKNWFIRHKPSKRRLIQLYAALLYNANIKGFATGKIYQGNTKYACVPGFNCYSCPGAVGACPLGSLQNALASSNTRAPFYVFGILILFGLLLGRTICGFLCPMGLIQDLLYKIKSPKLKKSKITRVLSYFKYVLLAAMVLIIPLAYASVNSTLPAFCKYICPVGTLEGSVALLWNSGNESFFGMLGPLFTWKFTVMILIIGGSIFVYRLFCRFICPLGAIYSLFCKVAMIGVKLDKQKCVDCGLCIQTCKMDIKHVGDHECIHCGECLKVCPTKAISWKGSKIFLHANAVEPAGESASGETVALADILNGGKITAINTDAAVKAEFAVESAQNRADEQAIAKMEKERTAAQKRAEKRARRQTPAYIKKRNIILEAVAWVAALAVLATALVYYNFIYDPAEAYAVYAVGDTFTDFTLKKFFSDEDAEYTLSDDLNDGKVVILNFWYMGCEPCQQEIPYFCALAMDENYADKVSLVIVHAGDSVYHAEDTVTTASGEEMLRIERYVSTDDSGCMGWGDIYECATWCIDTDDESSIFLAAGGNAAYPVTVILDSNGVVQYQCSGSFHEEDLYREVDNVLNMESSNIE